MNATDDARELLFSMTAVRLGLVDRQSLIRLVMGMEARDGKSLARLMTDRGLLTPGQAAAVEAEVAIRIEVHDGDARRALTEAGPFAEELGRLLARHETAETIVEAESCAETICEESGATLAHATLSATMPMTGASPPPRFDQPETQVASVRREPSQEETIFVDNDATMPVTNGHGNGRESSGRQAGSETSREALEQIRYRILRLHAKGGLGQVFIARDEELNRNVALKEIQGRYSDDDQSRLRFLIEAEVTGNLEHPGIVPVYGLGRYPDGRPYYAMRFVEGTSLREAIKRFHDPHDNSGRDPGERALEFRKLLSQLVDVCNAMAYAHSRGILHRDLKPDNVMLGAFGETLVVDWGLAKFKDMVEGSPDSSSKLIRPMSAGSGSQTLFGSALGTPQYMSPEQATGQLDQLGPTTDIYSLGAILFTILVGDPPFVDRQLATLLSKVIQGDFRPPLEVKPGVSPALDAICRKAMSLRPEDRYASSRAMADDLEHWLADEPVSVYREPFLARAARWARRHKTAVAMTAALLVTAVVSLAIYSVLIKREQERTERFYVKARAAVDQMLTELGDRTLADTPELELVRRQMLSKAQDLYQDLQKERANDPGAIADVAVAGVRLGDVETLIGKDADAEAHYNNAIKTLEALKVGGTADLERRRNLAHAYKSRGELLRKQKRIEDAERDLKESVKLRESLLNAPGASLDDRRDHNDSLYHLAALHDLIGKTEIARSEYGDVIATRKALAEGPSPTLDDLRLLGRYTNNMANILVREKNDAAGHAKQLYNASLKLQKDVVAREPGTAFYRYELAKTHGNLRIVLAAEGDLASAREHAAQDVELSTRLVHDFPHVPDYRIKLAAARSNLGMLWIDLKKPAPAREELDLAVSLARDLVKELGDRREYRSVLASALLYRTEIEDDKSAEADLQEARDVLAPNIAAKSPPAGDILKLGTIYFKLAKVRARHDRVDDALADLDRAIALHEQAGTLGRTGDGMVASAPSQDQTTAGAAPPLWSDVALQFELLKNRGDFTRCAEVCERLPILRPTHAASYRIAARMLAYVAALSDEEPDGRGAALAYAARAVKLLREAAGRSLLEAEELDSPYYSKVRELFPNEFRGVADAVKRPKQV